MVKFAHLADVHLGGWKAGPMQELNFQAFQKVVNLCINRKVDFVLIAGDLFDSAYPPIEILKETFAEFKKLKDAKIPVFLIAGSHDYSVSGKTFLDVLEKAGFCKNVFDAEFKENEIILNPTIYKNFAFYGYPGKKSGLEIQDLRKIKLNDSPGMFKILMLHTTMDKVRGALPIDCLELELLPEVDYYALGHVHVDFHYQKLVYPGPVFPNNFQELETLNHGTFYIIDLDANSQYEKIDLKLKDIESIHIKVKNASLATQNIINELEKRNLKEKVVLLRIEGLLIDQNISDIKFDKIEEFAMKKGAYFVLRNTHDLNTKDAELNLKVKDSENIEEQAIKSYSQENPSKFNDFIEPLIHALSTEKQEGETQDSFSQRIIAETNKIFDLE
jgi:DNA repair protein SbcD/Mre11